MYRTRFDRVLFFPRRRIRHFSLRHIMWSLPASHLHNCPSPGSLVPERQKPPQPCGSPSGVASIHEPHKSRGLGSLVQRVSDRAQHLPGPERNSQRIHTPPHTFTYTPHHAQTLTNTDTCTHTFGGPGLSNVGGPAMPGIPSSQGPSVTLFVFVLTTPQWFPQSVRTESLQDPEIKVTSPGWKPPSVVRPWFLS